MIRFWPGTPYPLGATWDGRGVNFALFSAHAEKVELCLFDTDGACETARIKLPEQTHNVWHGYLPDAAPGQLYGYRVYGAYAPQEGSRFNHHKLLLDPYAKMLVGTLTWDDSLFGYRVGDEQGDLSFDERDSAPFMPKCRVIDPAFTWGSERRPQTPWSETVIYELHPRGFTIQHPEVTGGVRGTFAGLTAPAVVEHLRRLGVTAVELLPSQSFVHDRVLIARGLHNYWGYNSLGFFAPHADYIAAARLREFKTFVHVMHDAKIEVLLDVVYNHTAEGNEMGPTLCYRGIDNVSYYHLVPDQPRHYMDFTGCGNAFNLHHRQVMQLVMDSLRYWVQEMHVDGFRFDLASTLAREQSAGFDDHAAFLDAVAQDPVLSSVKLIAEPWDTGSGGYQLGHFPPGWAEWNDRYRDVVRRFWVGDQQMVGELASRISGSSDIFGPKRRPWASINFITAHDGFTLNDLVSYDHKHNEANGEDNRDGSDNNHSWNCGAEGPTDDAAINRLRRRQQRNFLATLFLSQGVPMLLAGDEIGNSQGGNNNAYCQDSPISWISWAEIDGHGRALETFVRRLIRLRRQHIVLRRQHFLSGVQIGPNGPKDIVWLRPDGAEKTQEDWEKPHNAFLCFTLSGEAGAHHRTRQGEPEPDDTFMVVMSAHPRALNIRLPDRPTGESWRLLLDTAEDYPARQGRSFEGGQGLRIAARSLVLLVVQRSGRPPAAAATAAEPEMTPTMPAAPVVAAGQSEPVEQPASVDREAERPAPVEPAVDHPGEPQ